MFRASGTCSALYQRLNSSSRPGVTVARTSKKCSGKSIRVLRIWVPLTLSGRSLQCQIEELLGCSMSPSGPKRTCLLALHMSAFDPTRTLTQRSGALVPIFAEPRARHVDINFTRDLDASPPEEWGLEIDQRLFPGGYFKEFIFFHKASKTLILTDTIINIELDKMTEPWVTATKLTGMYYPFGQIFFGMRLPLLLQRQKAEAAIRKIRSWQPQRILLSHGRCFDAEADVVIRRIFG